MNIRLLNLSIRDQDFVGDSNGEIAAGGGQAGDAGGPDIPGACGELN